MSNMDRTEHQQPVVMHYHPTWVDRVDSLVTVDLFVYQLDAIELLWCRELDVREYEVGCIPFFYRGLALGDIVRTNSNRGYIRCVRGSGHRVLQILLVDTADRELIKSQLDREIATVQLECEWHEGKLCAVDLPEPGSEMMLLKFIRQLSPSKLLFDLDAE